MAKQQGPQINSRKEVNNIIYDAGKDSILLELGQQQFALRTPDGELIHRSVNESFQTCDNFLWNPTMLQGAKPIYLAICNQCQKRSHGIVTLHRSKLCSRCGHTCCPSHRRLVDSEWLCLSCARKRTVVKCIRFIFMKKKED